MDWNAVEAIAEIAGVILVVVSLLFVGFQVRQNTQQLRQDNLLKSVRGTLDTNWYFHRDPEAFRVFRAGCADFDALPEQDRAHFHSILMDLSFYVEVVNQMYAAGLLDQSAPEVNGRFFLAALDTPGGAQWWELVKKTRPMPDSAIVAIQALLDAPNRDRTPITELQPWFAPPG
jgi:hypothetical protein